MNPKEIHNGSFFQTIIYSIKLSFEASKFYTFFRLFYSSISALTTIGITYIGKIILDTLTKGEGNDMKLTILLLLLLTLSGLNAILIKANQYVSAMHNDILRTKTRLKLMNIAADADMEFFDSSKFYDAFEKMKMDSFTIIDVVWNMMMFLSFFISMCSAFIIIGKVNLSFGLIIIAATIPTAYFSRKYAKELYFFSVENVDAERKMNYLETVLSDKMYASDVRLYHLGDFLQNYFMRTWNTYFERRKKITKKRVTLNSIASVLPEICIFFILLMITKRIMKGENSIGDYSLYSGMLLTLMNSTFEFIGSAIEIYDKKLKIENMRNFQKYQNKIADKGSYKLDKPIKIEFRNVSFKYPDTEKTVLDNVSFVIQPGEHIGLVGLNGSGKSTLIKLLLRFYEPTSGQILLNERNIKDYPIHEIRSKFSTFFQQYVIFAFSMKDNVTMFDPAPSKERILEALSSSDAMGVYELMGKNLDTHLTKGFEENGIELSGGQRQKIALARAFYRDSEVLILDEPSSALDPEAEYRIFERMKKLCSKKTTIFISHRLSNIISADKIILLEYGKIIEQGNHYQLIEQEGRYAKLFEYQAKQYKM